MSPSAFPGHRNIRVAQHRGFRQHSLVALPQRRLGAMASMTRLAPIARSVSRRVRRKPSPADSIDLCMFVSRRALTIYAQDKDKLRASV